MSKVNFDSEILLNQAATIRANLIATYLAEEQRLQSQDDQGQSQEIREYLHRKRNDIEDMYQAFCAQVQQAQAAYEAAQTSINNCAARLDQWVAQA